MQNFSIEPIYNGQKDVQNQYYYTYTLQSYYKKVKCGKI